jgi:signal transduction histidine kinase/CheY-like chemotaxis protein
MNLLTGSGLAILAVIVATLARDELIPILGVKAPFIMFYPAVAFAGWFGGLGPGLVATFTSTVLASRSPALDFRDPGDLVSLTVFTAVNVFLSVLNEALHRARRRAEEHAMEAQARGERLAREIQGRIEVEASLSRARREAEAANHAKDDFLALVGHELRNPLASVRSAVQILQLLGRHDVTLQHAGDVIDRQVSYIVRLVDDLVDVSRITRGMIALQTKPLRLQEVLAKAVENARPLIESKRHDFGIEMSQEEIWMDGDETRLIQAVTNVLLNAAQFTPSGGRITLAVATLGDQATITVRDTGIGIPADALERIFDPFAQEETATDRQHAGLGIGLTLARRLVELHGGLLSARSDGKDRGSEFSITLPLATPPPSEIVSEAPPVPNRASALDVLLVEDNVDVAGSLTKYLELVGHRVEVAHDGPTALRRAEVAPPDVALIDIGLPAMSGHEVARRMRRVPALKNVHLVALSGYARAEHRERALAAGFDDYLVKPFDLNTLLALIAGAANERVAEPKMAAP